MFRALIIPVLRNASALAAMKKPTSEIARKFSQLTIQPAKAVSLTSNAITPVTLNIASHPGFLNLTAATPAATQVRTLIKYSMKLGKRKTVKAVLKRFMRLDWGIWIRTKAGRHKKLWKKSQKNKYRLRQHIFCNATQSYMLDKMVTPNWRKPKHYVDDPYKPFHTRENHWATRRKPIEWDL